MAVLDFITLFKDRGAAQGVTNLAKSFDKAAGSAADLETATKRLAVSETKVADAAGAVRVAEARLASVRNNAKATAAQTIAAEEGLARAKRQHVVALREYGTQSVKVDGIMRRETAAIRESGNQVQKTDSHFRKAVGGLHAFGSAGVSATGRLVGGFKAVGIGAAGVAVGIAAAATAPIMFGLKTAAAMENAEIAFTTMLGSARKARTFLGELQRFAAKTPFEFPELQKAASSLISVGINAKNVIPIMKTLGNVTSGMGTGSEGVQRATVAIQQMSAAGRITAEDLNQLRDAGIPLNVLFEAMSKKLGVSSKKLFEMSRNGELGKKELAALLDVLQSGRGFERFNGLMDKQSKSLNGMLSTLKDTFGQGMANTLKGAIPFLKQGIGALTDEMGKLFKAIDDHQGEIKEVFRSIKRAMKQINTDDLVAGIVDVIEALPGIVAQLDTVMTKWQQFTHMVDKFENATGKEQGGPLGGMVNAVERNIKKLGTVIQGGWNKMTAWVVGKTGELKDKVVHGIEAMWRGVVASFKRNHSQVVDDVKRFASRVVSLIGSLPGRAKSALSSLAGKVSSEFQQTKDRVLSKARDMVNRFVDRMQEMVRKAKDQAGRVKGAILDRFSGAASWLYSKGKAVINGLLDGLKAPFGAVKKWVSGIASWIKAHKGPVSLDRQLLHPAGKALMEGLLGGLKFGFKGVGSFVYKVGGKISDIIGKIKSTLFAGIGTGFGKLATGGYRTLGRLMAAAYGWTGANWNALNALWTRESGWNPRARNPSSGAAGIPQDITGNFHGGAAGQIAWGLRYIKGRYGSPLGAWAHSQRTGWYDQGGMLPSGGMAMNASGRPERILSPVQTKSFDRLVQVMGRQGNRVGTTIININAPNYVGSVNDLRQTIVDMNRRGQLEVIKR